MGGIKKQRHLEHRGTTATALASTSRQGTDVERKLGNWCWNVLCVFVAFNLLELK